MNSISISKYIEICEGEMFEGAFPILRLAGGGVVFYEQGLDEQWSKGTILKYNHKVIRNWVY